MRYHIIIVSLFGLLATGCTIPKIHNPFHATKVSKAVTIDKKPDTPKEDTNSSVPAYEKPTPEKEAIFVVTIKNVAHSTQTDPRYQKLALDTAEKKAWFKQLLYRLWDRQITRAQFIKEGLRKYPDREYEFRFIADSFQKYS